MWHRSIIRAARAAVKDISCKCYCCCRLQVVPVYSIADGEDWRIRGYTKCVEHMSYVAWLTQQLTPPCCHKLARHASHLSTTVLRDATRAAQARVGSGPGMPR